MYSSPTDVRNALTPGADVADTTTASSLGDPQITDAIKEADGDIDTYISLRYGVPQDPELPSVAVYPVRAWSRDIAAYLATLTFRRSKDILADDPVRLRYQRVMDILQLIADGKLSPNLPQPPEPPDGVGPQGAFVYNLNPFKLFTPASVFSIPNRYGRHRFGDFRYGDIALSGSGYDEVLVLAEGQSIPAGTANDTLVVFIPEGS